MNPAAKHHDKTDLGSTAGHQIFLDCERKGKGGWILASHSRHGQSGGRVGGRVDGWRVCTREEEMMVVYAPPRARRRILGASSGGKSRK
jgi:hypothetical protein